MTSRIRGSSVRPHVVEEVREALEQEEEEKEGGAEKQEQRCGQTLCEDILFQDESEEALLPSIARDPGAPTERELQDHSVTHLPHRSWCPICVESRARDRPHRAVDNRAERGVPEVHFDYGFLGNKDEEETQAIQVARDVQSHMLLAHHVPRKGMASEHGAQELVKDLAQFGHAKVILK